MKILRFIITSLIFALICQNSFAMEQNFVSGISSNEISIDSNFNGQDILLFGAKASAGKLIVAVRGPKRDFLVTKKDKTLGIWHNSKRIRFKNTESYYAMFSTFDDSAISPDLLKKLGLGMDNLNYDITIGTNATEEDKPQFTNELIKNLKKENLYYEGVGDVVFLDETLFKVTLHFPKNISQGVYNVDLYFLNEGALESFQTIPIYVNQVGLSAKISKSAYGESFIYGIASVLLALIMGWVANYIFNRFIEK